MVLATGEWEGEWHREVVLRPTADLGGQADLDLAREVVLRLLDSAIAVHSV